MTDENQTKLSVEESALLPNSDHLLKFLVRNINKTSIEIGITLNVKGTVISGLLISGRTYFEGLHNEMNGFSASEVREAFQAGFAKFKSAYAAPTDDPKDQEKPENIVFIHLKDAKFSNGSFLRQGSQGVYWRGRLSSIDGFCLGNSD